MHSAYGKKIPKREEEEEKKMLFLLIPEWKPLDVLFFISVSVPQSCKIHTVCWMSQIETWKFSRVLSAFGNHMSSSSSRISITTLVFPPVWQIRARKPSPSRGHIRRSTGIFFVVLQDAGADNDIRRRTMMTLLVGEHRNDDDPWEYEYVCRLWNLERNGRRVGAT